MGNNKIIYLTPQSTFITELRSDTLWGIICWAIRNLYGNNELESFIQSYIAQQPEFIISSTFPFTIDENKEKIPYFPRPILPLNKVKPINTNKNPWENVAESSLRKKIKKVTLLKKKLFEDIINSKINNDHIISFLKNKDKTIFPPIFLTEDVTHNKIDRIKGGTLKIDETGQLFHSTEMYFNSINESKTKIGLFFLAKGNTEKLITALRWLSHVGIGGDRSTGKGFFKFEVEDFSLNEPADYNAITNISLYYPTKEELQLFKNNPYFNYQLEKRKGYMGFMKYKKFDKPATIMFKEGSVFPKTDKVDNVGTICMVKPKDEITGLFHDVYQYGLGFMIKMKINDYEFTAKK